MTSETKVKTEASHNQYDILDDIAVRSHGSANFGLGGQAVAAMIREGDGSPDKLAHMLAVALNDISFLKRRLDSGTQV